MTIYSVLFSVVGAPTTSTRTLGGIRLEFGLKFSGAGEAASTTCSKFFRIIGMLRALIWNLLHNE